jgi:FkbM family methyltransferase
MANASAGGLKNLIKTASLLVLPPIAVAAARRLFAGAVPSEQLSGPIRLQYGKFFLECDASHNLPRILSTLPDYGRNAAEIVRALSARNPVIIDVGANIGDTALLVAGVAPGARILCIEGYAPFMPFLTSNTAQLPDVVVAQAVLSDRTAPMKGRFDEHRGTAHLVPDDSGLSFATETLDDLLGKYPAFSHPDVIKIDTDGFDGPILRGARGVLKAARPIVFYEWDPYSYSLAGEDNVSHAELLIELGYERFLIFDNRGDLLLHVRQPGPEVWQSLSQFSLRRRAIDGWYYDIAAFTEERRGACESVCQQYARPAPV